MSTGMIVLAEDDPKLRKLYSDFLEVNGFTVAVANSEMSRFVPSV